MLFGFNEKGDRVSPSYSGQRTTCPLCNSILIGKCGEINVWHWAHATSVECDSWKEHETEWHRKWKAKFPKEFREVIIQANGEKHIADIQTPSGLIIEFQNSPISTYTIQIRENFYQNMIWVINAQSFKDHFSLRSIVNSKLQALDQTIAWQVKQIRKDCENEIKAIDEKIKHYEREIELKTRHLQNRKDNLVFWQRSEGNPIQMHKTIFDKIESQEERMDYNISQVYYMITSEMRNRYYELTQQIQKLKGTNRISESKILDIMNLSEYPYKNTTYRKVDYEQIAINKYKQAIAISQASWNTLFHHIVEFKSEQEFLNHKRSKNNFIFAMDLNKEVSELNESLQESIIQLSFAEAERSELKVNIETTINSILISKVSEMTNEVEKIQESYYELVDSKSSVDKSKEDLLVENEKTIANAIKEITSFTKDEKFGIMKHNKGEYTFHWKHERKSWQYATKTLFLDVGEEYLFRVSEGNILKKVSIIVFLQSYIKS